MPKMPDPDQVRAAEAAQQCSVCDFPDGDVPAALVEALERRVQVNLERATDDVVRRVGGSDPEVRRLEAPYRKRRPRTVSEPLPVDEQPDPPRTVADPLVESSHDPRGYARQPGPSATPTDPSPDTPDADSAAIEADTTQEGTS